MIIKSNEQAKASSARQRNNLPHMGQVHETADLPGRAGSKKDKEIIELQLNAAVAQLDKFKNIIREKDLMLQSLKQENIILKQSERRCLRDLETLETETMEAPATIKHLKEDLMMAKSKLKSYFSQIGEDSRIIRVLNDEKNKQKEQIAHLTELVNNKKLEEREVLYEKLEKSNQKVTDLQKLYSEAEKGLEMVDKTLTTDNKHLRSRIHAMEKDYQELKDHFKELAEQLKEKDKVVASLSIYRYNAMHKKHETPPECKVCAEREKTRLEELRIAAVKEKIPILEIQSIQVSRGDSVSVQLQKLTPVSELDSYTIFYSDDPQIKERVHTKQVKLKNGHGLELMPATVHNLTNGITYYFKTLAANGDIKGELSSIFKVVVDCPPQQPKLITTMIEYEKKSIQILFRPSEVIDGSPITSFKIYYASTPSPSSKTLFIEVEPEEPFKDTNGNLLVTFGNPEVAKPHYFFVTACNKIGESISSDPSPVNIVDYKPARPEAPVIKKFDAHTVVVIGKSINGPGSPPSHFILTAEKQGSALKTRQEVTLRYADISEMKVFYPIEEGMIYKFSFAAVNGEGRSEESDFSSEIDIGKESVYLDSMVPAFNDLNLKITSPNSFQTVAPLSKGQDSVPIIGYKLRLSKKADMTEIVKSSEIIPLGNKPYKVDGLDYGECYYVTACLVGEEEEGLECKPVFVPLAAAIPLPKSPPPQASSKEGLIKSASSLSSKSRISATDKTFKGYSAYKLQSGNTNRKDGKMTGQVSSSSFEMKTTGKKSFPSPRKSSLANPEIKRNDKVSKSLTVK